ncbi:uncharacterized protein LOC112056929 isoform X2 [Bicyclus anynana]|uniref:Uncharacterized protein LOC112056929 isoform X2 n=1 Tax=Bicyclus anynana TaxID=110368 RepID=A0ABM3LMX2_BICAN|nr:uncharacterized protein LOC112056929 isoform X2 [Bicyclus anynana]
MAFLDSLDLDTTRKKCHRVRSWYLYEQYKSLEKNQLDAAQMLKNKSYQDKFLKQEIKERRARRNLCGKFGSCSSESKINRTVKTAPRTSPSVDNDDLCESFCGLYDELYDFGNISRTNSLTSRNCEDFKSTDDKWQYDDESVIKNICPDINLADDVKGELDVVKKNIADNIDLQLETVKENIEYLEELTKLSDDLPINDSLDIFEQCESSDTFSTVKEDKKLSPKYDKELFPTWAKLVAFAYKTVQFNHGNFYNEYSSQIMIAVLLCDVLRRGINKMSLRFPYKICA